MRYLAVIILLAVMIAAIVVPHYALATDSILLYQYTGQGGGNNKNHYGSSWIAQSFASGGANTLTQIQVYMGRDGINTTFTETVGLYLNDNDKPTGSALATGTISYVDIGTSLNWETINLATPYNLSTLTKYWLVFSNNADVSNQAWIRYSTSGGPSGSGTSDSTDSGATWSSEHNSQDLNFKLYGYPTSGNATPINAGDPKVTMGNPYDLTYETAKCVVKLVTLGSHSAVTVVSQISSDADTWSDATMGTGVTYPQQWVTTFAGLSPGTKYFYRAYAEDDSVKYYSPMYQFFTTDQNKAPIIQGMDNWLSNIGLGAAAWWLVFFILNLIVWWRLWDHKAIATVISCCSFAAMIAFGLVSPWIIIILLILVGGVIYNRVMRPGSA